MDITKTKSLFLTCLLAFAMCSLFTDKTFGQQGGVLRVDRSAPDGGDGSSWGASYNLLGLALDFANSNTGEWEIWVA